MTEIKAVDEIVNFIAKQSPREVIAFKASKATKKRVYDLIDKEKTNSISDEEKVELDYYLVLEHIMRLAKAKAYKLLQFTIGQLFHKTS